jgi:hypothetical protein
MDVHMYKHTYIHGYNLYNYVHRLFLSALITRAQIEQKTIHTYICIYMHLHIYIYTYAPIYISALITRAQIEQKAKIFELTQKFGMSASDMEATGMYIYMDM